MGQALRRASGRVRSSGIDKSPSPSSSSQIKNAVDRNPPAVPLDKVSGDNSVSESNDASNINADNVLEEKDQQYDAMLSQMVGRIQSKPGGKPEMGEAFVVERYNRPMPKLRSTKAADTDRHEERPVPSGTLEVSQIRQIVLLHEGKDSDHDGPMNIQQIAQKFCVDTAQVEKILQFVSLPPEDKSKQKKNQL